MTHHAPEILIVEDSREDIDLVRHSLMRGHLANSVLALRDGVEALDFLFHRGAFAHIAHSSLPLIVFLDLSLPKIGGLEVLGAIKNDPHTRTIPVVITTGSADPADRDAATTLGADGFVEKPITFTKLLDVAKKLGLSFLLLSPRPECVA